MPKKPRNEQLPAHLPRYEVEAAASEEVKRCAEHGQRKLIGYDRTETLEFERPKLKVRVTLYPKYICENEPSCGVREPPREPGLVEGNRYGTSVAAEIVTGKCGYHLPIYREQDYFAGCGWTVDRSTLLNIFRASAELVHPLALFLRGEVVASGAIGTDETRVTLLLPAEILDAKKDDPKSRRIHEVFSEARAEGRKSVSGRMWAYRSLTVPINVFDFTVSRHRDGPDEFLVAGGFVGKLLADCYSGYQGITLRSDARIVRAACNAHARRKLFDQRETYPLLSSQFLAMYQELYDIEERGKFLSVGAREELRWSEAPPVWQRMRELLDSKAAFGVLPKEKFAEALGYLRNQWERASRCTWAMADFPSTTRSLHTTPPWLDSDSVVGSGSCWSPFGMSGQDFLVGEIVQPTLSAVADGPQEAGSSPLADRFFTDAGPRHDLFAGDHACPS